MVSARGQTTTEYLIVGGVVIVIALIVISSMQGIFAGNTNTNANARKANLASERIGISDVVATDVLTTLYLKNNLQYAVRITAATIDGIACTVPASNTMSVGGKMTVVCPFADGTPNAITDISLAFNYTDLRTMGTYTYAPSVKWPALISSTTGSLQSGLIAYYTMEEAVTTQNLTIADVTGNAAIQYNYGSGNGDYWSSAGSHLQYTYEIYAYKNDSSGTRVYSQNPITYDDTEQAEMGMAYTVYFEWDATVDADGYRIIVALDGVYGAFGDYYFDLPASQTSIEIDFGSEYGGGISYQSGNTVTPKSGQMLASSGTVSDASTNGYDANLGGFNVNTASGIIGNAFSFDGTGGFIEQPSITFAGSPQTISMWIKFSANWSDVGDNFYLIDESDGNQQLEIQVYNYCGDLNRLCITAYAGPGASQGIGTTGNTDLGDGNWHHLAVVINSSNMLGIYLDGTLKPIVSGSGSFSAVDSATGLHIASYQGTGAYTPATIDEVAFWNRALTAYDVLRLYNNANGYSLR